MKKVLLVDDDSLARTALAGVLEQAEVTVLQAADGKIALEIAASELPQLIVTDVHMPNMDGLTMIKNLRDNEELKRLPVIVLTVDEAPATLNQALSSGVTVYLSKASADPQFIADQIFIALG